MSGVPALPIPSVNRMRVTPAFLTHLKNHANAELFFVSSNSRNCGLQTGELNRKEGFTTSGPVRATIVVLGNLSVVSVPLRATTELHEGRAKICRDGN